MYQKSSSSSAALVLALLAGASLGAVVVALTTPKTGREVRDQLRTLGNRLMGRAGADEQTDDEADLMYI